MRTRGEAARSTWTGIGQELAAEQEQMTAKLERLERGIAETNERLGQLEDRMTRLELAGERKQSTGS